MERIVRDFGNLSFSKRFSSVDNFRQRYLFTSLLYSILFFVFSKRLRFSKVNFQLISGNIIFHAESIFYLENDIFSLRQNFVFGKEILTNTRQVTNLKISILAVNLHSIKIWR